MKKFRGGATLSKVNCKGHIIICGWNFKAEEIIRQLQMPDIKENFQIVILTDKIDANPLKSDNVFFVKGDTTNEDDLKAANIMEAKIAIILADLSNESRSSGLSDAKTILTTLTIETINPDVYTCVEVLDPNNIQHLKRANANEIIASSEISGKMLVSAAINHGVTKLISKMLTFGEGSEVYVMDGGKFAGKTFQNILRSLAVESEEPILPIAVRREGKINLNPPKDFVINKDDQIFVLAEDNPSQLKIKV